MAQQLNVHFIAIGGSVMHQLAIALRQQGHNVTGSDDDFFEPSKSTLEAVGLLPVASGWYPEKITSSLDAVIVGMHARDDNPELLKAQELNIKSYSFPEFINEQSKDKQRIVIGGSHGKTTITAMIVHVLNFYNRKFDYVIGAKVAGISQTVKLTDAPLIIIEGDEYPSSPMDKTPKFLKYHHHIGLISGIAWDHINAFPTEDEYLKQFEDFADATPKAGSLVFCEEDPMTTVVCRKERADVFTMEYKSHSYEIAAGQVLLTSGNDKFPVKVFGKHNMQNISGAKLVLKRIGITEEEFYKAIQEFPGAQNRLEVVDQTNGSLVYKDYAHAPSKVQATVNAVRELYPNKKLFAVLELHTFSSLSPEYLPNYKNSLSSADAPFVYYNPEEVEHKKLNPMTADEIKSGFNNSDLEVFTAVDEIKTHLQSQDQAGAVFLFMSSGNFGGLDLQQLFNK